MKLLPGECHTILNPFIFTHSWMAFTPCCKYPSVVSRKHSQKEITHSSTKMVLMITQIIREGSPLTWKWSKTIKIFLLFYLQEIWIKYEYTKLIENKKNIVPRWSIIEKMIIIIIIEEIEQNIVIISGCSLLATDCTLTATSHRGSHSCLWLHSSICIPLPPTDRGTPTIRAKWKIAWGQPRADLG